MKLLRVLLFVLALFMVAGLFVLWITVPKAVSVWKNSNVQMSPVAALFITLSNYARTPIGMFATLNLWGLWFIALVLTFTVKRKV
jgi:hypothetical protein